MIKIPVDTIKRVDGSFRLIQVRSECLSRDGLVKNMVIQK